jgi:hypothetical protein
MKMRPERKTLLIYAAALVIIVNLCCACIIPAPKRERWQSDESESMCTAAASLAQLNSNNSVIFFRGGVTNPDFCFVEELSAKDLACLPPEISTFQKSAFQQLRGNGKRSVCQMMLG